MTEVRTRELHRLAGPIDRATLQRFADGFSIRIRHYGDPDAWALGQRILRREPEPALLRLVRAPGAEEFVLELAWRGADPNDEELMDIERRLAFVRIGPLDVSEPDHGADATDLELNLDLWLLLADTRLVLRSDVGPLTVLSATDKRTGTRIDVRWDEDAWRAYVRPRASQHGLLLLRFKSGLVEAARAELIAGEPMFLRIVGSLDDAPLAVRLVEDDQA